MFWPSHLSDSGQIETASPTSTASAVSYVDDDNFTWVSPSVYMIFNGMSATDYCGLVGSSIGRTIMSFDPQDVSSILVRQTSHVCYFSQYVPGPDGGPKTLNIGSSVFYEPPESRLINFNDVAQNCSTIEAYTWLENMPESYYQGKSAGGTFPEQISKSDIV